MFDIGWTEIAVIVIIAIVVIGPKDLPRALKTVGEWVGRAKALTREFRRHVDDMIRESELDDIKKQIESAGNTDVSAMVEHSIDPKGELKDAFEFGGEEFARSLKDDVEGGSKADESKDEKIQEELTKAIESKPEEGEAKTASPKDGS